MGLLIIALILYTLLFSLMRIANRADRRIDERDTFPNQASAHYPHPTPLTSPPSQTRPDPALSTNV